MIGADDMAFPTLNMLTYWFMWPAFVCMIGSASSSRGGAAGRPAGPAYPPLSALPAGGARQSELGRRSG